MDNVDKLRTRLIKQRDNYKLLVKKSLHIKRMGYQNILDGINVAIQEFNMVYKENTIE